MMNRHVFITGVSSGIGRALATRLLDGGDSVYGLSRRPPGDLEGRERFHFAYCDLRQHGEIEQMVTVLLAQVPRLDLAILNAGILPPFGDMAETGLDTLRDLMEVNVWANKTLIDTLFRNTREVRQVVVISSGASVNGNRGWNGYSISKAAVNMLVKLYAEERPDTHFCALAPGIVDTGMQQQVAETPPDPRFPALERLRSKRGTKEMPSPEEAAGGLLRAIERLPELVKSGEYADVRELGNERVN